MIKAKDAVVWVNPDTSEVMVRPQDLETQLRQKAQECHDPELIELLNHAADVIETLRALIRRRERHYDEDHDDGV